MDSGSPARGEGPGRGPGRWPSPGDSGFGETGPGHRPARGPRWRQPHASDLMSGIGAVLCEGARHPGGSPGASCQAPQLAQHRPEGLCAESGPQQVGRAEVPVKPGAPPPPRLASWTAQWSEDVWGCQLITRHLRCFLSPLFVGTERETHPVCCAPAPESPRGGVWLPICVL